MVDRPQVTAKMSQYDPAPRYPVCDGTVLAGWAAAAGALAPATRVLAVDGPAAVDWDALARHLGAALAATRPGAVTADARTAVRDWAGVRRLTESEVLRDDPDFAELAGGSLADLMDQQALDALAGGTGAAGEGAGGEAADGPALRVLVGPGAALAAGVDEVWWADLPKRCAEAAVGKGRGRNLGAPAGEPPSLRRLFYIDWPLQDRHRDATAARIDRWVDVTDTVAPTSISGQALRATCHRLADRPFRTLPTFNSTPWGGHWGQEELGHNPDAPNTALGYELIAPESGVLLGDDPGRCVEVPFQLVVALAPVEVLGKDVHERFGTSFPIRFDYLDTVGGGNLSVHCHPQPEEMRTVFGWPYTQHESYYLMRAGTHSKVFLGLREGADLDAFHHHAHAADTHGEAFDIEEFVQTFPARAGQLYLVPAGTPHGSGEGNVVLEVSATPYLYSLRFYDWLRRDAADRQRAVHVEHAFRNLDPRRSGEAVSRDLVQRPRTVRDGDGWREELLGALPDMFFEVRRIAVEPGHAAEQTTDGRFHVLTVVDGEGVLVETAAGDRHFVHCAETLAVPAAVTAYRVQNQGPDLARLVKAQVV
ncbi:Mannose-6-phosphate isomerase, class I [Actinacidiphila yanglinensis]|uniref:Mannose-6-phosphate isomerase, class I n=1 Tax=Actinacidiphila yanglinensis TaxID=310779 RepID=A0A1H6E3C9_9ACTN|nr:class I mannose-6-phosphate isomerase [Actinacidiphila yanglinensis]SEG91723.1 Mannose-6-phosphate isomerase, class I [Actinacidiphila yanglinensis]